jgi:hypothetical protein
MAEKRKLSEAVKPEDPAYMTPNRKKARTDEEDSPAFSPAVQVELPNTAEARRIAAEETKKEEDRSKAAKGIGGRKKRRTMRRKSHKHRRTHKKRKF